jgi:outer membrane receptor for ferrienterochelin and colicin
MRPLTSNPRLIAAVWLAGGLALAASPVSAQGTSLDACALSDVAARYRAGDLPGVMAMEAIRPDSAMGLRPRLACEARTTRERLQIFELLAMTHLANDDVTVAQAYVNEILATRRSFSAVQGSTTPRFLNLLEEVKRGRAGRFVSSVSKSPESLNEAPATVQVITAEDIARRGYQDLEQIIHDLPGFDVSRSDGFIYSTLYQRGYRSAETNRTLFLIDGVEENNLSGNEVFLSRQYPLSNVARIEVVYGPASTMYGANAFLGVINVITKDATEVVSPGEALGTDIRVFGGSNGTRALDATLGGVALSGSLTWTVTTRIFGSDGQDLSALEEWDYDPADYDGLDYGSIPGLGQDVGVDDFLAAMNDPEGGFADCTGTAGCPFRLLRDGDGSVVGVEVTADGEARARAADQAALGESVGGRPVAFSDPTDDVYFRASMRHEDFALGFQRWTRKESPASERPDLTGPGGENGEYWIPAFTSMWASYQLQLTDALSLTLFSRFKIHELDGESTSVRLQSYGLGRLGLADLAQDKKSFWERRYFARSNSQLRNEIIASYESRGLNFTGGVEFRSSSVGATTIASDHPKPLQTGAPTGSIDGGNRIRSRDLGFFAQSTWDVLPDVKVLAGGRVDRNTVREAEGFGTVFNPRLAVISTQGRWVLKAVYSEAFLNPSNFQRYETFENRERPNPGLAPEKVKNMELGLIWAIPSRWKLEVSGYRAVYSDIVEIGPDLDCTTCSSANPIRFQNLGELRVRGVQAAGSASLPVASLWANYTYTHPLDADDQRIHDIASHRLNLGVEAPLGAGLHLSARWNIVGARPTGLGTTAGFADPRSTDAYTVLNTALTYSVPGTGLDARLVLDNLFDTEYRHPGIKSGDGIQTVRSHPQPGRRLFVHLTFAH